MTVLAQRLHGVRDAAAAVQRDREHPVRALAQRVRGGRCLQVGQQTPVLARGEPGVEQLVAQRAMELFQAHPVGGQTARLQPRQVRELREGGAAPLRRAPR